MTERYSRQEQFEGIGKDGQERLGRGTAVVVGIGAVSAGQLVRAGVGRVRLVDRDFIELHNLQRQPLYDEEDVRQGLPKAIAAQRKLQAANAEVVVEAMVTDLVPANIVPLLTGADVVVDGLDNFVTRLLLNDACLERGIPYIYGGAVGAHGTMMAVRPGAGACFRCLVDDVPDMDLPTCETAGVIAPAPAIVASWQAAEALKVLAGRLDDLCPDLVSFDLWTGEWLRTTVPPRPGCRACAGDYDFLQGRGQGNVTSMCGQNAVQVRPPAARHLDLDALEARLSTLGRVTRNEFMLTFVAPDVEMVIFPDGRAIVRHTDDVAFARSAYAHYIGT
jgi:molybdopterin/thiamine biosynthesis adenylyltransferase